MVFIIFVQTLAKLITLIKNQSTIYNQCITRELARIDCGLAWIVTMVMNMAIYYRFLLQME